MAEPQKEIIVINHDVINMNFKQAVDVKIYRHFKINLFFLQHFNHKTTLIK